MPYGRKTSTRRAPSRRTSRPAASRSTRRAAPSRAARQKPGLYIPAGFALVPANFGPGSQTPRTAMKPKPATRPTRTTARRSYVRY